MDKARTCRASRWMRLWSAALLGAAFVSLPMHVRAAEPVARLLGQPIGAQALPPGNGQRTARALMDLAIQHLSAHAIERHGLLASDAEIDELARWNQDWERQDRVQRQRKLKEIEQLLRSDTLEGEKRRHAEEFRDVLARMALEDGQPSPQSNVDRIGFAHWVEAWKFHAFLQSRYGGAVGLTKFGPYPQGAVGRWLQDERRESRLEVLDHTLSEALDVELSRPPEFVIPADKVDFTPYWKRPVPSSYYPDARS